MDWTAQIRLKRLPKLKFTRMRFAKLQAGQAKRRAGKWSLDLLDGQIKSGSAPPASHDTELKRDHSEGATSSRSLLALADEVIE